MPNPAFAWPYSAKAVIQHEWTGSTLNVWVIFRYGMNTDTTPPNALWLVYADSVLKPISTQVWQDAYTLLLTVPNILSKPTRVETAYDGPDENLHIAWDKQWEPFGKILSQDQSFYSSSPTFVRVTVTEPTLSPFVITSQVVNTNLNADLLDGKHVGTTGNVIPLTDGTNVWTGANKININSASAFIVENTGTKNNVFRVDTTNGRIGINCSPFFALQVQTPTGLTTDIARFYCDAASASVVASSIQGNGVQAWNLFSALNTIAGKIVYALPGGNAGIVFTDGSNNFRSDFAHRKTAGGFTWGCGTGSGVPTAQLTLTPTAFQITAATSFEFGTYSALAAEVLTGYITIKDAAGNVRKLAVIA